MGEHPVPHLAPTAGRLHGAAPGEPGTPPLVGPVPVLPWPLNQWSWWKTPVRAERLAAFRVCVAAILLWDILSTYLPYVDRYFGPGGLVDHDLAANRLGPPYWNWSLMHRIDDVRVVTGVIVVWAVAAAGLLVGYRARLCALVCWVISMSLLTICLQLHNGGDRVRQFELFYLMISPCAATWSVDGYRRKGPRPDGPVYIAPWPVRMIVVQMCLIYCFSGIWKAWGTQWHDGSVLYYVMYDPSWARVSPDWFPMPYRFLQLLTWVTLVWEMFFPLLIISSRLRAPVLWIGVLFHIGTGVGMEVAWFPMYMICLYVPFVPVERLTDWAVARRKAAAVAVADPTPAGTTPHAAAPA